MPMAGSWRARWNGSTWSAAPGPSAAVPTSSASPTGDPHWPPARWWREPPLPCTGRRPMRCGRPSILRWATPGGVRRRRRRSSRGGRSASQAPGRRRLRGLRRPSPRLLLALLAVILLLGGLWLWLRDSSLVGVREVRVAGARGPDAAEIQSALVAAAHSMTTLDVNMKQLRTAVAPYPVVKSLDVTTQLPHGM